MKKDAARVYEGVCKRPNVFHMCEEHTGVREQVRGVYMCRVLAVHTLQQQQYSTVDPETKWWSVKKCVRSA